MKTKIKRHSRAVISVILAISMLVSCMMVGLIATDAARVNDEAVGGSDSTITDYKFKGAFDSWTEHYVNSEGKAFINIDTAGTYEFVVVTGGGTQRRANKTFTESGSYNTSEDNTNFKITVANPGTYTFQTTLIANNSVTVTVTFPSGGSTTSTDWRLLDGDFSTSSTKKFTLNSSTGKYQYTQYFSSEGDNYFRIYDATNTKEYSGDDSTTADYTVTEGVSASLVENTSKAFKFRPAASGNYVVTLETTNNTIVINAAAKYDVTCTTPTNGTLTTSVDEAYAGNTVTITATPNTNYTLKSLVLTYDGVNHDVTNSVTGNSYTFTMPAFDVTATATFSNSKTIYFNNYVTQWSKVFVYTKNESGEEGNGASPGQEMTRLGESSIYQVEIPADSNYIVFTGSGGTNNKGGTITCNGSTIGNALPSNSSYNEYKATNTSSAESSTGEWSIHQGRTNVYTVTPDSTITENNNLYYSGINATLYDYYTDNEYLGGWLTGITNSRDYTCDGVNTNDPFRTYLNTALSGYASANSIAYPLYWGNNKDENKGDLCNFYQKVNNSQGWGTNKAITGLTGLTLSNSHINHYKNGASNQNGAEMVAFDEDWLSRENSTGNPLATILHSPAFPVRKEAKQTIVLDANGKISDTIKLHYWKNSDSGDNGDAECNRKDGNVYYFTLPSGYDRIAFYTGNWDKKTSDLTVDLSKTKYTVSSVSGTTINVTSSAADVSTHTYYEYDSTNGKDNAFITSINPSSNTANMSYYADSEQYVQSEHGNKGFYPFDYNNIIAGGGTYDVTKVYLNPTGDWALNNERYAVYFLKNDNSAAEWRSMTYDSSTGYYVCDIPDGYSGQKLIFVRMNGSTTENDWANKWNQTPDLNVPTDNQVVYSVSNGSSNTGSWGGGVNVPFTPGSTNGYADTTNHKAHDLGFGMKLEIPFTLNKNGLNEDGSAQTFDFSGDDDLWVFVDDQLVLDLGGAHGRTQGSINFSTMQATALDSGSVADGITRNGSFSSIIDTTAANFNPDQVHTMTIYYTERGMFDSNLKFGFSFHTISNLYTTEKKVRTNNINSGFYVLNNTTNSGVQNSNGYITKFEKSYQTDSFDFDHKVSSELAGTYAYPLDDFTYSKVTVTPGASGESSTSSSQTYTAGNSLSYSLTNDDKAQFNGKFDTGDYFKLTETADSGNKYNYTPSLTLYDDNDGSTNDSRFELTDDGSGSYRFQFDEDSGDEMQVVNVRARFQNAMNQHSLTITKNISGDTTTNDFTFKVLFNFDYEDSGDNGYEAYPLYISSSTDGTKTQLNADGSMTIKAGEIITIAGIPENADFKIIETGVDSDYNYGSISAIGATPATVSGENAVTMTMGSSDINATINNVYNQVKATIRVKYAPSYYDFENNTANIKSDTYKTNGTSFDNITNNIGVRTEFYDETYNSRTNGSSEMTEKAVTNASDTFNVRISDYGLAGYLFIGWYDENGNRWNDTDETQHEPAAEATKAQDRVFEARFIAAPTYRIDYDVPTRLWGSRIYKVFGTVDHSMINSSSIGYDSSRDSDKRYYITGKLVESKKPSEKIFLKSVTWANVDTSLGAGKNETQYNVSKTVTSNADTSKNVETQIGTVTYSMYRYAQATVTDTKLKVDMYNDCSNPDTCQEQYECNYGESVNGNKTVAENIPDGMTFYRWRIETLDSLGKSVSTEDNTLVTYDYSKNFNYVAYDNYKVTAEIIQKRGGKDFNPNTASNPNDPYYGIAAAAVTNETTVINLGQTRSHWNDTITGQAYVPGKDDSISNTNANYNYDRLFIDLALSYSDGNETMLNSLDDCTVGFKIQYYKNDKWNDWANKTVQFSSKELDNKNRIEYYYGFSNSDANRGSKLRVQPIINGVDSGNPVEFQFNGELFTAQT